MTASEAATLKPGDKVIWTGNPNTAPVKGTCTRRSETGATFHWEDGATGVIYLNAMRHIQRAKAGA